MIFSFENDNPSSFVPKCNGLALLVEGEGRDYVLLVDFLGAALVTEYLCALVIRALTSFLHNIL